MKRGYVVGEYILVSFFFLILIVLIVNKFTDFTLTEINKVDEFEQCKNSKRIFEKLFDDELVLSENSNYSNILSNYTSENNISILTTNISQLGFSSGQNKINHSNFYETLTNLNIYDWNNYENSIDSFSIKVIPFAANIESIYSEEAEITSISPLQPRVNIWLNDSVSNSNIVHRTIGVSASETTSDNSRFDFTFLLPNATLVGSIDDSNISDTLVTDQNEDYLKISGSINPNIGRSTFFFSFTSDTQSITNWGEKYSSYDGTEYELINNISKKNNLIVFENIRYYDLDSGKNYDIYFGNDMNLNMNWGPEKSDGCNYNRIYLIENDNKRVNYTINGNLFERNINPSVYSIVEVTSR